MPKFVVGAPVRKPQNWKCWHHGGDTSRSLEIQFLYSPVRIGQRSKFWQEISNSILSSPNRLTDKMRRVVAESSSLQMLWSNGLRNGGALLPTQSLCVALQHSYAGTDECHSYASPTSKAISCKSLYASRCRFSHNVLEVALCMPPTGPTDVGWCAACALLQNESPGIFLCSTPHAHNNLVAQKRSDTGYGERVIRIDFLTIFFDLVKRRIARCSYLLWLNNCCKGPRNMRKFPRSARR